MMLTIQVESDPLSGDSTLTSEPIVLVTDVQVAEEEKVLCPHCLRTATNGIKCKGICVADSDY